MTTTLNATTSNGLVVTPDNSGNVLLQYNGQSAPLFRAVPASNQTINHDTLTKVTWGTETYDTNNNFASSTFTPTVAGYYQINAVLDLGVTGGRNYYFQNMIYKNGSAFSNPEWSVTNPVGGRFTTAWADIVYCNGSTDYIEIYVYAYDYTASTSVTARVESSFSGCLLRGA
jgi:hypothetical protein